MEARKIRYCLALLLFGFMCFLPAAAVWAQEATPEPSVAIREDFSDDELKSFVKANEKVMAIQTEAEEKLIKAIEDEGLTVERFNEILEQQRDPSRTSETSADELASFNNAAQMILEENEKIEKQMTTSVEEEGIDIATYKQIMVAYQQRPDLQTRVHEILKQQEN
jgi:lipopolysaccharide export system protein LptA